MAFSTDPNSFLTEDEQIVIEAHKRFKACEEWEATARANFLYDYKFANGDSINMYQWDNWVVGDRQEFDRPCLTINKTMQHCLQIINDGKQNKPGVNIRPVGDTASFEAAQIFQEVIRHIEYLSDAENVYDNASEFQVIGGIGYWRVITEYPNDPKPGEDNFAQEIKIKRIKNPLSVYIDPNIDEVDGEDANFGFIFSDMVRDLYEAEFPDYKDIGGYAALGNTSDGWFTKDHVRVAEYLRKTNKKDKWVYFILPETQEEIEGYWSELPKEAQAAYKEIKENEKRLPEYQKTARERDLVRGEIEWYKIAGDKIIDRKPWLGKYIPIVRIIGKETVIDGQLDRVGHTRALLDPQRIYNVNSSANVEFGALQTKSPIVAPMSAIEGYEEYYKTANTINHSYLPYNQYDEDGNKLDAPKRMEAPKSSPAYVQQMEIAQNEMMMVSGQYQSQMGENENAKSGVAINARQRQGDRATYHFIDGQAIGIKYTGKILIDLIPKIYDTQRIMRIEAKDGTVIDLTIDPQAEQAFQKLAPDGQLSQSDEGVIKVIFNPNVGMYAVQADVGPGYATRRQEAFNALTQIAAQNKEFMGVAGDILWKVADFPEAQVLAQRWRRIIPPNILGDAPNPQLTQAMEQASAKIEQQLALITQLTKEKADREREFDLKQQDIDLKKNVAGHDALVEAVREIREDYKAVSDRIAKLGNSGPAFSLEQIQPLLVSAIKEALANDAQFGADGASSDIVAEADLDEYADDREGAGAVNGLPSMLNGGTPIEAPAEPVGAGNGLS